MDENCPSRVKIRNCRIGVFAFKFCFALLHSFPLPSPSFSYCKYHKRNDADAQKHQNCTDPLLKNVLIKKVQTIYSVRVFICVLNWSAVSQHFPQNKKRSGKHITKCAVFCCRQNIANNFSCPFHSGNPMIKGRESSLGGLESGSEKQKYPIGLPASQALLGKSYYKILL